MRKFYSDKRATVGDLLDCGFTDGDRVTLHMEYGGTVTATLCGARTRGCPPRDLDDVRARLATEIIASVPGKGKVRFYLRSLVAVTEAEEGR